MYKKIQKILSPGVGIKIRQCSSIFQKCLRKITSDYKLNSKTYSLLVAINYYFYGGSVFIYYFIIHVILQKVKILNCKRKRKTVKKSGTTDAKKKKTEKKWKKDGMESQH